MRRASRPASISRYDRRDRQDTSEAGGADARGAAGSRRTAPPGSCRYATRDAGHARGGPDRGGRRHDCDIRLSGAALTALRAAVQWGSPDQADQVNAFVRKAAVDYVTAYQKRGDAALTTYDDRMRPVSVREQWQGLLSNSQLLAEYAPELRDYLAGYPSKPLAGARDIFYWLKENYGLKPVLSIVHAVVYEPAADPERVYVAQKQLYADHYYDGSLALAVLQSGVEGGRPVTYLIYSNRSRGDMLNGGFGGLKRAVARKQARAAAEQTLGTIKKMLEAPPGR